MKICLVSQEYPPETGGGGIGTQTYLKAHGLTALGHTVHVLSASWDDQPRTYCDGGAFIHRIPEPELRIPGYEESTYWLAYANAVAEGLHALDQEIAFDIIQFPEYGGEGFFYQTDTFKYRTARYVVQLHGPLAMFADLIGWPEPGSPLYQIGCFMEQMVIEHADRLLASSRRNAAFCADRYGCKLEEIRVIHSAVDTTRFFPRAQPEDERHPRVLFVGNLVGNKGIASLVETVIQLKERYPKIALRAVGNGDKDLLIDLKKRVADAGAESNFQFQGYVRHADLAEHYTWSDFLVGPSVFEGSSNVYLEAMACARPVIACNTAGTPEIVVDQETGLLVPPKDNEALERAIVALTEDETLKRRLGASGSDWIQQRFSMEKYAARVEQLYKELI
jgi:glycosyltransferase involved in cell wall biosynthesis